MPPLDLSLVLACYNEEPLLVHSMREIVNTLEASRFTYELIFVDDGSRDRTRELIAELAETYGSRAQIRTIFHERNVGRGGTVQDGLLTSRGEIAGFIAMWISRSMPGTLSPASSEFAPGLPYRAG